MKVYQLPKAFAEKWITALRSGKYLQTTEILGKEKDGECSYCCLGVAATLQGFEMDQLKENGELLELSRIDWENLEEYDTEYPDLIEAGIPKQLLSGDLPHELIQLNDSKNLSFTQIADWIEENVQFI